MRRAAINALLHRIAAACSTGDALAADVALYELPLDVRRTLGTRLDSSSILTLNLWGLL